MSTFVSSTNSRRPSRGLAFTSRGSPTIAVPEPGSERLRRFKNFLRVTWHLYLTPFVAQYALLIEQESAALDAEILFPIQTLLLDDIEELAELLLRVAQQGKGKLLLRHEFLVGRHAVARDANNLCAGFPEGGVQVTKVLAFAGAPGGHVLRMEVDDQLLAGRILEAPALTSRGERAEIGYFEARFDLCRQDFTGSRMASRLSESQNSMNSSRRCATWIRLGTFTIICTENIGAPVCAAGELRGETSAISIPRLEKKHDRPDTIPV